MYKEIFLKSYQRRNKDKKEYAIKLEKSMASGEISSWHLAKKDDGTERCSADLLFLCTLSLESVLDIGKT